MIVLTSRKSFQEVGQKRKMVIKIEFTPLSLSDCKIFSFTKGFKKWASQIDLNLSKDSLSGFKRASSAPEIKCSYFGNLCTNPRAQNPNNRGLTKNKEGKKYNCSHEEEKKEK